MAKKVKAAGKRKRVKTSLTKLSNKRLNKVAKQGKLKKKLRKKDIQKLVSQRLNPGETPEVEDIDGTPQEREEPDIPLVEADYEYFAKPGRDLSFLQSFNNKEKKDRKRQKRKREEDEEGDELEQAYEANIKSRSDGSGKGKEMKAMLPIKTKEKGVIPQLVEKEEDSKPDEEIETAKPMEEEKKEELKPLTTAELFLQRQQKLNEMKENMAVLCSAVCEDPEKNYRKLRELRLLADTMDPDIAVTTKKILMVSLTEVFKDIIPDYKIRLTTEKEKEQQAKEETKRLRDFEESLVKNYHAFLELMECLAKGKDIGYKHNKKALIVPAPAKKGVTLVALRCMGDLLATHPHFNFRTELINCVIPFIVYRDEEISSVITSAVRRIFREDKSGEVTLEVTRTIGRLIKNNKFKVNPKVLKTFLSLRIKEIHRKEDDIKEKKRMQEKRRIAMSRRDKKRQKELGDLEKELKEANVLTDRRKRLRINTEIINVVFLTYFRILKQAQDSVLLPVVLEGLAKFAHLINIEFFDDLFTVLNDIVESEDLTYRESLHCVLTAFTILSGQGEALNIDPIRFYKHLYNALLMLHVGSSSEDVPLALQCLDTLISKRKKMISYQRLYAFMKRLGVLSLQLSANHTLGVMATLRTFMLSDSKSDVLLDTEHEGPGLFMPELDDPEHCNAHNTALYELHTARKHYHPVVRRYAGHLIRGAPSQGSGYLPPNIMRRMPLDMVKDYDASEMEFNPMLPEKPPKVKKVFVVGDFVQDSVQADIDRVLEMFDDAEEKEEDEEKCENMSASENEEEQMEIDTSNIVQSNRTKKQKTRKNNDKLTVKSSQKSRVKRKTKGKRDLNIGALQNL